MSEKSNKLRKEAEQLLKDARAAEFAMLKAEEYNEQAELSNATVAVLITILENAEERVKQYGFFDRLRNKISIGDDHTKLLKTYFKQMADIDHRFKKKHEDYKKSLLEAAKEAGEIAGKDQNNT